MPVSNTMQFLGNLLFRIVAVLYAALLPMVAPLEVRATSIRSDAAVRLTASALVLALAVALAVVAFKRSRSGAALLLAVLVSSCVAALALSGVRGPLGLAAPWLDAPLWIALASIAFAFAAPRLSRPWLHKPSRAWLAGGAVSAVMLLTAWPRIESRDAMWTEILRRDPGDEIGAGYVARQRVFAGKRVEAVAVLRGCVAANPAACTCVAGVAEASLDAEQAPAALATLDSADAACARDEALEGLRAEALVTSFDPSGEARAQAVLARAPHEPHALFASALAAVGRRDFAAALVQARAAVEARRGAPAQLLVAVVSMELGDLEGARGILQRLLADDPSNLKARYDLALVADRKNEYRSAREGYLAVLQRDPTLVDARYNLAMLTLRNGVKAEAQHHVEKLIEVAPKDPRIPFLQAQLRAR